MLYPENIEQKIGFDTVRNLLSEACISPLGKAYVSKIRFSENYDLIGKLIHQTDEMKQILEQGEGFPSQHYIDATPSLRKAEIEGMALSKEEFSDLKASLSTIRQCLLFFEKQEEDNFPILSGYAETIRVEKQIIQAIDAIIDDRGQVRENASPELMQIRRRLLAAQSSVRRTLDSVLKSAKQSGWVGDEVSLTIRNGRMVIPLAAEHKRKIKGFIHDESSTGQTIFIEPADVLESNNEIRGLEYEEIREIHRILMKLTSTLRPFLPDLHKAYQFLGLMDFVRAKARLAISMNAIRPEFKKAQLVRWENARHPLLYLSFKKQGKKMIPLNVELTEKQRILIISGPNAGGKSVALKTLGLIQYMFQCGLLVPVAETSTLGLFQNLFIDIGDEQSLENDLSTYSSHLTNMRQFLSRSNKKTLFLIDEFGTGTEPGLGGAIAEAILEELTASGAFGVVNTHYTNLKILASRTPGLVNGAMRFDGQQLEPLYELETGKPGSSFAFEIATKIGLPDKIIQKAKEKLGRQQVDFEKLLKELEIEKRVFSEKNIEAGIKERKLSQQLAEYTALKVQLENNQKKLLNEAKQKAKSLIEETNQRIEKTIREIRESKAEKEITKEVREDLKKFASGSLQIQKTEAPQTTEEEWQKEEGDIVPGAYVRVKNQATVGQVLTIKGKEAEIRIGDLKSTVKINRLERVSSKTFREISGEKKTRNTPGGLDMNEKHMQFSFNLDIRGKRGEEAITEVDRLINDAMMLGYDELRVVHGKGDGILRNLIRNHLRGYTQVAGFQDEHPDRGGAGVTIVKMK